MISTIFKKSIYLSLILILLVFLLPKLKAGIRPGVSLEKPYVKIKNSIIKVEIADDFEEQIKGLSNRDSLDDNSGMLFVFPDKQIRRFWMKDMRFPLDIIWINDNKIVKIDKNLPPEGEKPQNIYSSEIPVNYVLEVNGGYCSKHNINVGSEVELKIKNN